MKLENSVLIAASVVIFSIYIITLSPSIAGGDSGEVVAEGCHLGTAHPPGYPLFTLLVNGIHRCVGLLNIEGITSAYGANLSSAAFTAMASFFIGKLIAIMDFSLPASLLSMGMFSFSPLIWQYAVTAEVFPMNTFFAALIVYLVALFSSTKHEGVALFGAFVCGLALCNQHTIILFEAPLVLWMLILLRKKILSSKLLFFELSLAFFTGLLPYAYLPISELISPKMGSWGHVSSLSGFVHHFLRKDYGTFQLYSGANGKNTESLWERNASYWRDSLHRQGLNIMPILATIGIVWLSIRGIIRFMSSMNQAKSPSKQSKAIKKKNEKKDVDVTLIISLEPDDNECKLTPVVIAATFIFYFMVFHSLSNLPLSDKLLFGVHQRFWMQPNILMFAFGGMGFDLFLEWFYRKFISQPKPSLETIKSPLKASHDSSPEAKKVTFFWMFKLVLGLGIVAFQIKKNYFLSDQSQNSYFRDYGKALLDPLPPNAILLINYDMQWTSVRYLQVCEGYRSDVTSINLSMMTYKWFEHKVGLYSHKNITFPGKYLVSSPNRQSEGFSLSQFMDANYDKFPIFQSGKLTTSDPNFFNAYELIPFGLGNHAVRKQDRPNAASFVSICNSSWSMVLHNIPSRPDNNKFSEETWEWTIGRDFGDRVADTAAHLLELAISSSSTNPQPLIDAMYWFESLFLIDNPEFILSSVYKNAGIAHSHLAKNDRLVQKKKLPLPSQDLFGTLDRIMWPEEEWRLWCVEKFISYWGKFLELPDATTDRQYDLIKATYNEVKSRIK